MADHKSQETVTTHGNDVNITSKNEIELDEQRHSNTATNELGTEDSHSTDDIIHIANNELGTEDSQRTDDIIHIATNELGISDSHRTDDIIHKGDQSTEVIGSGLSTACKTSDAKYSTTKGVSALVNRVLRDDVSGGRTIIKNERHEKQIGIVVLRDDEVEITEVVAGGARVLCSPITLDSGDSDEESAKETDEESAMKAEGESAKEAEVEDAADDKTTQDQTCSICLSEFDNKAFLDQCFHAFCFYCVLQWSEVVRTCPLCKAMFSSIIHSVKSLVEFEQHHLPDPIDHPAINEGGRRFRYRTTLADGRQRQITQARSRDAWEQRNQRRQLYVSKRRHQTVMSKEKRRLIYGNGLWVQQVSQRGKPKFRDIMPSFFRANPACVHRLVPWLSRELQVLLDDNQDNVDFIMQLILTLITRIEIVSEEFAVQLQPFLADKAHHFAHEFASFARAPYNMASYDEHAQYDWPLTQEPQTPAVFNSTLSGWDTPDVIDGPPFTGLTGIFSLPGPSGLSSSEVPLSSWDDDILRSHGNDNWSPVATHTSIRDHTQSPLRIEISDESPVDTHNEQSQLPTCTSAGNDVTVLLTSAGAHDDVRTEHVRQRKHKKKHKHPHKHKHSHKHSHKSLNGVTPPRNADNDSCPSRSHSRTLSRSRMDHVRPRPQTNSRDRSRSWDRSRSRTTSSGRSACRSRSNPRSRTRTSHSPGLRIRSLSPSPSGSPRQQKANNRRKRSWSSDEEARAAAIIRSPTEEEMKLEIEELEARIAVDTQRLIELQRKQHERRIGDPVARTVVG